MIVELDPRKWFGGKPAAAVRPAASGPVAPVAATDVVQAREASTSAKAVESTMGVEAVVKADAAKALTVLEAVGKDFAKGLAVVVKYAPEGAALANALFPASVAVTPEAVAAVNLLQNAIVSTEAKYAASGVAAGTGTQKAAEVLAVAGPAATTLLTSAGASTAVTAGIDNVVNAIVGVLNVQQAVTAA